MMTEPLSHVEAEMRVIKIENEWRARSAEGMCEELRIIGKRARKFIKPLKQTRKRLYRSTKRLCDLLDALV